MTGPPENEGDLPATPAPRTGPLDGRDRFTPVTRWLGDHQAKVLCIVIAILVPLASLALLERATANLRTGVWAYSVDAAGSIHYSPVSAADAKSTLFREILLQATQSYYTRNPAGLSYPEIARRIFVGESWKHLQQDLDTEGPERKRRNLYDHPEVEAIELLDESPSAYRYRVRGYVVRAGSIEGLPFQPPPGEFHLIVELTTQTDALQQGRYPFVIDKANAAVHWPSSQAQAQ